MQWRELTVILDWHRKDKFTTIHVSRTFGTKMFQEIHVHSSLLKKQDLQGYTLIFLIYVYSQSKAPYSTFNLFLSWYVTPHPCMMKNILKKTKSSVPLCRARKLHTISTDRGGIDGKSRTRWLLGNGYLQMLHSYDEVLFLTEFHIREESKSTSASTALEESQDIDP